MQRLVTFDNAESRPTPLTLLAMLREIDRTAELVYVGERQWWLGAVSANEERAKKGRLILDQMYALDRVHHERPTIARNIMLGKLLQQGFARIEAYHDHGDPAGRVTVGEGTEDAYDTTIVEDFRQRDFHWRKDQGASMMDPLLHELATGEQKRAESERRVHDYMVNDGRDHYHRIIRNRVSVGFEPPAPGSSVSRIITNLS